MKMKLKINNTILDVPKDLVAPIINEEIRRMEREHKFQDWVMARKSYIRRKRININKMRNN